MADSLQSNATLGASFATALAAKDFGAIVAMMAPQIDFRAMTPRRIWETQDPDELVSQTLTTWFEDSDEIEALESLSTDAFADCERVGYRFRVRNPEGTFLVEQQAYLLAEDGRISWMRVMCSGFRPIGA